MPRLLFYALIAIVAAVWMRRLSARASRPPPSQPAAKGMPQRLVCGACGKEYEPLKNGWLCPQCHR